MAKCSSCQFHNMPGTGHCGRCGASLLLATAVIDVYPPRARKWVKIWRKSLLSRQWRNTTVRWAKLAERIDLDPGADLPGLNVLLRLIVPGWPQQVCNRSQFGKRLFGAYAVCSLIAAVLMGTAISSFFIAVAISIHAASIYDVAHRSTHSRGGRLSRFSLGCGILGFCLYIPAYSLISQLASPFAIQNDRLPLRAGEVLIANLNAYQRSPPRIGDVVVYEIPETSTLGNFEGRNAMFVMRGQRLDRVLAGPNQKIHWENETLTIDGSPSQWMPLNPKNLPPRIDFTVPVDHCLIFPSTEAVDRRGPDNELNWRTWSAIPVRNIRGRIYWRSWPLTRLGLVR